MKNPALRSGLCALSLLLSVLVNAAGVHQHGLAEAAVVLEGKTLTVRFQAPLMDIIGTEQPPADAAERVRYAKALARVTQPEPSMSAHCELEQSTRHDVDALFSHGKAQGHDGHDHHSEHADVENEWAFVCQNPDKIKDVTLPFLATFPSLSTDVILLLPTGQSSLRLAPGENRIRLE